MKPSPCPHCLNKVYPTSDGKCPSCRNPFREVQGSEFVLLEIHEGSKQPDVCFSCGNLADQRITIKRKQQRGEHWLTTILAIIGSFFLHLGYQDSRGVTLKFRIKLPFCAQCKRQQVVVEPEYLDLLTSILTLKVHRNYRAAFEKLNRKQ